jgi:hypothetical protein
MKARKRRKLAMPLFDGVGSPNEVPCRNCGERIEFRLENLLTTGEIVPVCGWCHQEVSPGQYLIGKQLGV